MRFILAFFLFCSSVCAAHADKELAFTYINSYKEIAIQEMHRTGIPASIKLAQGLLESDWGRSDLAKSANNHFGIKCGGSWDGSTFYKEDDDRDHRGKLIKSCFRSFSSPTESYMAHSDFLTDPKKQYRYGFLFEYNSTDYRSWAKGLKKSGYATDPKYPDKLISIIEKYNLDQFDSSVKEHEFTYATQKKKKRSTRKTKESTSRKSNSKRKKKSRVKDVSIAKGHSSPKRLPAKYVSTLAYDIDEVNNVRMVKAKGGETISELARKIGISEDDILSYNEIYDQSSTILNADEFVYIEKKKRSYRGGKEYHMVEEGETMESIAQLYGIRVKSLFAKNRMPKQSSTFEGVKLSIRKTVGLDERPQFKSSQSTKRHTLLFQDDDSVK